MSKDDFETPGFDDHDPDHEHVDPDEGYETEEEQEGSSSKSKGKLGDLKKYALPAAVLVVLGGLFVEGPKIRAMVMGSPAPAQHTSLPHGAGGIRKPLPAPIPSATPDQSASAQVPSVPGMVPQGLQNTGVPALPQNPAMQQQTASIPAVPSHPVIAPPSFDAPAGDAHGVNVPSLPGQQAQAPVSGPVIPGIAAPKPDVNADEADSKKNDIADAVSDLGDSIGVDLGKKSAEIRQSISDSASHTDDVVSQNAKDIEARLDELTKQNAEMQAKLDALKAPAPAPATEDSKPEKAKESSKSEHRVVRHPVVHRPVVQAKKSDDGNGLIGNYHLMAVSKSSVLVQGPGGKYYKLAMGSTPEGAAGRDLGTIEGVVNAGDNNWYLKTSKGRINE